MLSDQDCKTLLNDEVTLTDEQLKQVIQLFYFLASTEYKNYQENKTKAK